MKVYAEEFKKCSEIVGFKNIEVKDPETFLKAVAVENLGDVEMQFFDADLVATWQHLYFASLNALTAFRNGENLSKSLAMETMLYASGRRQIQKATGLLGIKPGSRNIALFIIGCKDTVVSEALLRVSRDVGGQLDDSVIELSQEKMARIKRAFDISEVELETVTDLNGLEKAIVNLVLERVALLTTKR